MVVGDHRIAAGCHQRTDRQILQRDVGQRPRFGERGTVQCQFGLEPVGVVMKESVCDRLPGGLKRDSLGPRQFLKKIDPTVQRAAGGKVSDGLQPIAEKKSTCLVGARKEAVRSARDLGSGGAVDRELVLLQTCPQESAWLIAESSMEAESPSAMRNLPKGAGLIDDGGQIAIGNPNLLHRFPMPLVGAGINHADRHRRMHEAGLFQEVADEEIGESQRDRIGGEFSMVLQPRQQRGGRARL